MERALRLVLCALASGVVVFACTVNLGDKTHVFFCTTEGDCGGDGFKCAIPPMGNIGSCCKPTGAEVCNGIDDDCNGLIDDGFPAEICNGKDDNCNGQVDEGFDLNNDPNNCGMCMRACGANQICLQGGCIARGETDCNDGIDNDNNGKTDCADPSCNTMSCGPGCQCRALQKAEGNCDDGIDNDQDGKTDCADEDCAGAGCFDGGCTCESGKATETNCSDGLDDDEDGQTDCLDSDCDGKKCSVDAGMNGNTCAAMACSCNGGAPMTEMGVLCRDRLDNDCNGLIDCQEPACDMQSCAPDGGTDCYCVGGAAKENNCADRIDNDNDGFTDCMDSLPDGGGDCPLGTACTYLNPGGMVKSGTCQVVGVNHLCSM